MSQRALKTLCGPQAGCCALLLPTLDFLFSFSLRTHRRLGGFRQEATNRGLNMFLLLTLFFQGSDWMSCFFRAVGRWCIQAVCPPRCKSPNRCAVFVIHRKPIVGNCFPTHQQIVCPLLVVGIFFFFDCILFKISLLEKIYPKFFMMTLWETRKAIECIIGLKSLSVFPVWITLCLSISIVISIFSPQCLFLF